MKTPLATIGLSIILFAAPATTFAAVRGMEHLRVHQWTAIQAHDARIGFVRGQPVQKMEQSALRQIRLQDRLAFAFDRRYDMGEKLTRRSLAVAVAVREQMRVAGIVAVMLALRGGTI